MTLGDKRHPKKFQGKVGHTLEIFVPLISKEIQESPTCLIHVFENYN